MRATVTALALVLATLPVLAAAPAAVPAAAPRADRGFDLEKVADGVYALIRREPAGLINDANVVFIVNDEDVVVVDTNITRESARKSLAALRALTPKPVRYVVNTHFHDDHVAGNQVWREAFPGVEFIAHVTEREDLFADGITNRKGVEEHGPELVQALQTALKEGKNLRGEPISAEERRSYESDVELATRYIGEIPSFQVVPPTITVTDALTLYRGSREIRVQFLGCGHSPGDLVVVLPKEKVVIAGDLTPWPIPLMGLKSCNSDWSAALDRLAALHPVTYVNGHGPLMHDDTYIRNVQKLLGSLRDQAKAAVAKGEKLDDARKGVDLDAMRTLFAGDDKSLRLMFGQYVTGPGFSVAWREAGGVAN